MYVGSFSYQVRLESLFINLHSDSCSYHKSYTCNFVSYLDLVVFSSKFFVGTTAVNSSFVIDAFFIFLISLALLLISCNHYTFSL